MSDGAAALVLPVLRNPAPRRRYVLAEEAAEGIRGEDLGRINRLRIRNEAASRVFLRPGLLFQSRDTQSRGTTAGVLLNPRDCADIEVCCVHASCPIVEGAGLELSRETAPDGVLQALLLRDQGLVWASVTEVSAASRKPMEGSPDGLSRVPISDDLMEALAKSSMIQDSPKEPGSGGPIEESQCGMFVLDAHGVVAAEVFDSPDSWRTVSRDILNRYAPLLAPDPTSPVKTRVEPEAAVRLAKDFLNALPLIESRRFLGQGGAAGHPLVEYTASFGEVIHLVAMRGARSGERTSAPGPNAEGGEVLSATGAYAFESPPQSVLEAPEDGETVAAGVTAFEAGEDLEPIPPTPRVRRRKVLTSGWDPATFEALEHYSRKEFRGDRSAAMRFLVRHGLGRRGYLGPRFSRGTPPSLTLPSEADTAPLASELGRTGDETRIRDLTRIAMTDHYAGWLRDRAYRELGRIASSTEDGLLRAAAQSALDRIAPIPPTTEQNLVEIEAPPAAPSVDVPGLLRRALTASAAGNYAHAIDLFRDALDAEPSNTTALLGCAVALRKAGKRQEALAGLDLVLRLEPQNAAALLNRGRILLDRGDLKDSLDAFDQLVQVAPNDWDVWMARGDVLARMGRDEDALRSYAEALRRNPDDEGLQRRARELERARAGAAPGAPQRIVLPRGVEQGQSYLVKERRPDLSYHVFKALAGQRIPSLLITRQPLAQTRREPGLGGVRVLGLGHHAGTDVYSPTALASLSLAIERFIEENHGRGVLFLDGLETLVSGNGFRNTLLFVEHVNELVVQRKAIFLISVAPEGLPEREMALLERNLNILS